jgi:hypothetical protein
MKVFLKDKTTNNSNRPVGWENYEAGVWVLFIAASLCFTSIYICILNSVTALIIARCVTGNKTFVFIYRTGGDMTEGASSDESTVLGELGNIMWVV